MASSVVRVVRTDHDRLPRLLRRVVTPGPSQQRWRDELLQLLHAHLAAERQVLTATVVDAAGPDAVAARQELVQLDRQLARAAEELADEDVGSPRLHDLGQHLSRLLDRHDAVTGTVLRRLEAVVPRKEIRQLGGEFVEVRDTRLHAVGAAEPPPRRLDLPRAELYELARQAGVEGRSAMSRGELIAELAQRQQQDR
jgi:hypothetical protein